jgi:hypothetical protein
VHVHHPAAERGGGRDRGRHGGGDVVELQVEEDAATAARQRADDIGTLGGEEPAADLEAADDIAQIVGERQRRGAVLDVERN